MVVENVNGTELRFKNPGRLLLLVIGFLFWGVGFLDLLGHKSADVDVLGLYSLPFFIFILLYGSLFFVWILLFFNADLLSRVVDGIRFVQSRTWLSLVILAGLFFAMWLIFEWDRWSRLPGLQFALFGLVMLAILILVFAEWGEKKDEQVWRKFIAYPLFVLFAVELILQALAWFGLLPGSYKIGGDFYTYERVYYNGESLRNDFANRYGWYYPDAALDKNKKRILVLGGSYMQALQVQPEQQLGVRLSSYLNQDQGDKAEQTEVIPIGLPGFGLSPFLYEEPIRELPVIMQADEIVVLFHLGDDFQSPKADDNSISYSVSDEGKLEIDPNEARLRHDLTHYYLRGFIAFQLVGTIRSAYLTPKVVDAWLQGMDEETANAAGTGPDFPRMVGSVTDSYTLTEPGHAGIKSTELNIVPQGNNFMFLRDAEAERQEALAVAEGMLKTAQEISQEHNIPLRVVTVPMFPEQFFSSASSAPLATQNSEYDLLLPEKALVEIAQKYDIAILPMGEYMLDDGLAGDEIGELFLPNTEGAFTAKGQEYFAKAIYECFYVNPNVYHSCSP